MLRIRIRGKDFFFSESFCSTLIAFALFELLLVVKKRRDRRNEKSSGKENSNKALKNLRGGDDRALLFNGDLANEFGYFEVKNFRYLKALKELLNCDRKKKIVVVSAGVLKAVELFARRDEIALGPFISLIVPKNLLVFSAKIIAKTAGVALVYYSSPLLIRNYQWLAIVTAIAASVGPGTGVISKVPLITPNVECIEYVQDRELRVLVDVESPAQLMLPDSAYYKSDVTGPDVKDKIKIPVIEADVGATLKEIKEIAAKAVKRKTSEGALVIYDQKSKSFSVTKEEKGGALTLRQEKVVKTSPVRRKTKNLRDLKKTLTVEEYSKSENYEVNQLKRIPNNKIRND